VDVAGAPAGLTYFEFIQDRLDAAQMVKLSRCGLRMMLSLETLGPIYSVFYTEVAIQPGGFLDQVIRPHNSFRYHPCGFRGLA